MTAADDLRAAAGYIEKVGHVRRTVELNGEGTPVCALGGIARVCGLEPRKVALRTNQVVTPRYAAATLALRGYLFAHDLPGQIPTWNDHTVKDAHEVTVTLEKAAAWIEEQA